MKGKKKETHLILPSGDIAASFCSSTALNPAITLIWVQSGTNLGAHSFIVDVWNEGCEILVERTVQGN